MSPPPQAASRRRVAIFAALLLVCAAGIAIAIVAGVRSSGSTAPASAGVREALPAARRAHRPMVLFRDLDRRGQVEVAGLGAAAPSAPQRSSLTCARVAFRAGRGLCLQAGTGFAAGYRATVFGTDLEPGASVPVEGIPSRARVSPDGRFGAVTLFVTGHAYAEAGSFSTETTLLDLRAGTKIATLEDFTTYRGERQVTAEDVNYWGVTFADDGDTFYATLATGGKTYLIRGSVGKRVARTLKENVECPSLSPDGTRIAYKKRITQDGRWRLAVLDVATLRETPLAETRSVDDQVEWLDDDRVLYAVDGAIWQAPADGSGRARRFADRADSPAVVRW